MALQNEISLSFTEEELQQADAAITTLETIFGPKLIQLTAEQNKMYGRMGNETGNWMQMVHDDAKASPNLVPPGAVDMKEWDKDDLARRQLMPLLSRLNALTVNMDSTARLLGFDMYNACLFVYKYVKTQMELGIAGTKSFFDRWRIQFPGKKAKTNTGDSNGATPSV